MMARPECAGKDEGSLRACIERANACNPRSMPKKIAWFVGIAFVVAMSVLSARADKTCISATVVVVSALFFFLLLLRKWLYFIKAEELSYGLERLVIVDWGYMEMWFSNRKNYWFGRIMRSPAFILIAGFYYKLKVGDEESAAKLLALARGRDPELETIEMTTQRGLLRREREVLMEKLGKDIGVAWLCGHKRGLWTALNILYALECVLLCVVLVIVLVDVARLLIKGLFD